MHEAWLSSRNFFRGGGQNLLFSDQISDRGKLPQGAPPAPPPPPPPRGRKPEADDDLVQRMDICDLSVQLH